jgi:hypothetical protein
MSDFPVSAPGGFVPAGAVTFADAEGEAIYVDADNPLPAAERPFQGCEPLAIDIDHAPRRGVALVTTVAGNVAVKLANNSVFVFPVPTGLSVLPFAAKAILSSGTTATLSAHNLV